MKPVILALVVSLAAACLAPPARAEGAAAPPLPAAEWRSYASRFVTAEGRILDNGNGDMSHSEGQGYGLLLAAKAGDAVAFATIWAWTSRTLLIRKDGLAAWKWDPSARAVTDTNNATDGDILIAWGLAEAARRFDRPDYRAAAEAIARAIGAKGVMSTPAGRVLAPGVKGFGPRDRKDGPVVNLSYWIFPAFPVLEDLAPRVDWAAVRRNGLALLERSRFGERSLPSDWESLAGRPGPAAGFPAGFGYNAIRIPLYLAMDGHEDTRAALRRLDGLWREPASPPPTTPTPESPVPVSEAGYDLVIATARCATGGARVPAAMLNARSTFYYPETLRLLSMIALKEGLPACL